MSAFGLAWLTLLHQRMRTLISLAGVAFAVILIFMQLGFLGAVERTATQLYDHLDFDLILVSSEYIDLMRSGSFPRRRLAQAHAVTGVERALPLTTGPGLWRDPRPRSHPAMEPRRWNILTLGVQPADVALVFKNAERGMFRDRTELGALQTAIGRLDVLLIDRQSRPEFGTADDLRPGSVFELNERRVELAGKFEIGTGFGYNGLLLASEETLTRVTGRGSERITFGLVKLAPGVDPVAVKQRMHEEFGDARAYTRDEINAQETKFWIETTAVGRFFRLGVAIALVVGVIFVYQMIAADIRNHLSEYATFKAMGYRQGFLFRVVLWQANLLALVGFFPGLLASLGFYELTREGARIPIGMTASRMVSVLVLTLVMCLCSGLLAVRKLRSADPADLF
jgi:putative ABC transport system permease protein